MQWRMENNQWHWCTREFEWMLLCKRGKPQMCLMCVQISVRCVFREVSTTYPVVGEVSAVCPLALEKCPWVFDSTCFVYDLTIVLDKLSTCVIKYVFLGYIYSEGMRGERSWCVFCELTSYIWPNSYFYKSEILLYLTAALAIYLNGRKCLHILTDFYHSRLTGYTKSSFSQFLFGPVNSNRWDPLLLNKLSFFFGQIRSYFQHWINYYDDLSYWYHT